MPIYTIDIPDEAVQFIKSRFGQDVESYINQKLIRPLMDHFEAGQREAEIAKIQPQIDEAVTAIRGKIKLEKVEEVVADPVVEEPASPDKKQIDIKPAKG